MSTFYQKNREKILELSFTQSNQAVYWLNLDGHLLFANDIALKTLGYTLEEISSLYLWDVDALVDSKKKYLEKVNSFNPNFVPEDNIIESKHRKKNGEIFPVEVVSKFVEIDGEKLLISYARDISRRHEKNRQIQLYFSLINSSTDMIFVVDHSNQRVVFANDMACKNLEYELSELQEMRVDEFRQPLESVQNFSLPEVFQKLEESSELVTYGIFRTKSGKKFPVETSLHFDAHDEKNYVTAISRDISDRLQIEQDREQLNLKLQNYNKTLEEEVNKAKSELMEYEALMRRQSKMAAMGEMLENIAHQWRQPLSAISVLSTGMVLQNKEGILDNHQLDAGLNSINEQVQYLSRTIDDFRSFFLPNKARNRVDSQKLIDMLVNLSMSRYDHQTIKFITNVESLIVETYENDLIQVLINIVSNAKDELLKCEGKQFIFIDLCREDDWIKIRIKDNAGGINEEIIDKIFEPYFSTKKNEDGTGIGLYMSKNITENQLSGSLSVENKSYTYRGESYEGALFTLSLPDIIE